MATAQGGAAAPGTPAGGMRLTGTVAMVTGASRGIGRAIAQALAAEGADLCLTASSQAGLADVMAAIADAPGRKLALGFDVADRAACLSAVARCEAHFGRLDALVNNAGIYLAKGFLEYEPADFQRLLDVNLFGVIHLTQAALPGMLERGYGRIVNIASTAGKWGSRNQSAYNISKHAVVGLTRCVAIETAARGVTVNAICPGFIDTDMLVDLKRDAAAKGVADPDAVFAALINQRVPMARALRADEIAGMAVHLASPQASGLTGQSILIDGGMITA
ncbi:MAG TPA: SDR family NAD(P)-dependent oxidoreductase [Burkholderiaceae bacterium]|jgi:NAD(P)-dependent dehydrogenase (short-subunit alcohol dehydrogenase family)|nr:SDR family NAD(P)-dependent oxidoreductase [Burkholderiaceae bacterium]